MLNVVFINPPIRMEERYGTLALAGSTMPSLGLCYLAGVARANGFKTAIIEASALNLSYQDVIKQISTLSSKYIALTATTLSICHAAELAREIKDKDRNIVTIIGGPHITAVPEETMNKFPQFDIGVIGEGEETLVELLNALENNGNLKQVSGLVINGENSPKITASRCRIKNLDTLPIPAWDLLTDFPQRYKPPLHRFEHLPAANIVTARGCPHKCIFCDRSVFGNFCRPHSAEYVMKMIKHLYYEFGVREILIEDDTFLIFQKRLKKICQMLIEERLDLSWSCLGRVDAVNPQILKLMRKAGCWQIGYGIESGSQRILDFIKKGINLEQIQNALLWTRKAGIKTKGFFMIGHPLETKETIEETIRFAKRIDLDDFDINKFTPFPGSEINKIANKYGKFDNDWEKMNLLQTVFVPFSLTKRDIEYYSRKALREFYLRPNIIFSHLRLLTKDPVRMFYNILTILKMLFKK